MGLRLCDPCGHRRLLLRLWALLARLWPRLDLALVDRLLDAAQRPRVVETGGDDADLDVVLHPLVDDRAEDDVRLGIRRGVDDLRGLVHLEQRQVRSTGDREENTARAVDGLLEQRRHDRLTSGIGRARLAGAVADAHKGRSGVGHDRLHVGEVEVDETGHGDEVADALHALAQDVIDDAERVAHRRALLDDLQQPVIGDGDQRVDLVDEVVDPLLREKAALASLEPERLRDDGHGEGADVLGDLGDDRGGAGPGAAAHPRGHEDHVRFLEGFVQLLAIVLGRLAADGRVRARAKTLRDLVADADLVRCVRHQQGLRVGVHRDEFDAHQLGADHAVHRIRSTAADADDLYQGKVLYVAPEGHGRASTSFHAVAPPRRPQHGVLLLLSRTLHQTTRAARSAITNDGRR